MNYVENIKPLKLLYKDEKCPICDKYLIFNHDYTKANCQDINCKFNNPIDFECLKDKYKGVDKLVKNNRKIIKFTKSPQHKTITISTERHGFIGHISLRELKDFLDDEFTDITELTNDWETYYVDKK